MSNKKIEAWKIQVAKDKSIFVASNVKSIHPVVDRIVTNLCKIDLINYVRVTKEDIYASNEIKIIGRTKMPVSTPGHPSAVGVHLILDFIFDGIQFFEITSAVKGYGEKMVKAVVTAIPDDWEAAVVMDYSGDFWDREILLNIVGTNIGTRLRPMKFSNKMALFFALKASFLVFFLISLYYKVIYYCFLHLSVQYYHP